MTKYAVVGLGDLLGLMEGSYFEYPDDEDEIVAFAREMKLDVRPLTAGEERAENERFKEELSTLKEELSNKGFGLLYTSDGKITVVDVSDEAKKMDKRTEEIIIKNIDLERELTTLKARVEELEGELKEANYEALEER